MPIDAAEMRAEFVVELKCVPSLNRFDVIVRQSASRVKGIFVVPWVTGSPHLSAVLPNRVTSIFHAMCRITGTPAAFDESKH